jgi:hypothetical protein
MGTFTMFAWEDKSSHRMTACTSTSHGQYYALEIHCLRGLDNETRKKGSSYKNWPKKNSTRLQHNIDGKNKDIGGKKGNSDGCDKKIKK